jgi:hypothetical protein
MTICTIDVHARDVVAKMIMAKARAPPSLGTWEAPGNPCAGLAKGSRTPSPACSFLFLGGDYCCCQSSLGFTLGKPHAVTR